MKTKYGNLVVVCCFLIIIALGSTQVLAHTSNENECNTCHTKTTTLGLTSNATGTIQAKQDVPFTLTFTGSNGAQSLKIGYSWQDNQHFDFSDSIVRDGDYNDDSSAVGTITVDIEITPEDAGNFTIRLFVAAGGGYSKMLDVDVDVQASTTTSSTSTTTTTTTDSTSTSTSTTPTTATDALPEPVAFPLEIAAIGGVVVVILVIGLVMYKKQ